MKVIIAGSRTITSYLTVVTAFQECPFGPATEIVSGGAIGVDKLGERIATEWELDLVIFKPNWKKYGKAAGFLRNQKMGDYADALIAVWDGKSRGTKQMIEYMESLNKKVYIHYE